MNFLAHIYLSGENEKVLVGNFIADFVKGNQYQAFEKEIQQGVLLHRQIDSFTDNHPQVRISTRRLQEDFGKYAGVITDIFYDHFLAKNFQDYAPVTLSDFAQHTYQTFQQNHNILPPKVQEFLPYMVSQNWLLRYADLEGIERSLKGISRRSLYAKHLEQAIENLTQDYEDFEQDFRLFFPEMQRFVAEFWKKK